MKNICNFATDYIVYINVVGIYRGSFAKWRNDLRE